MTSDQSQLAGSRHEERAHEIRAQIDRRIAPWKPRLGNDQPAYEHHIIRVLLLCDRLHLRTSPTRANAPSREPEYLTAAAFHDLGIWTARTFDYIAPSIELARAWLSHEGQEELEPVVTAMIEQHHKIRRAGAPASSVEIFRRADTIDVTLGLRRFGLPRHEYRTIARRYPDSGFHRRLVSLAWTRLRTHPASPLPMLKW